MSAAPGKLNLSSELLHDLRTPLNQIIGYSEMLAEESPERDSVAGDLQKIRAAGRRMLEVIDENFMAGAEKRRTALVSHDDIAPLRRAPEETAGEPAVILVVDDDESNRGSTRVCRKNGAAIVRSRSSHNYSATSSGSRSSKSCATTCAT